MARKRQETKTLKAVLPPKRHEPGQKMVLLIDGMNMAYRARYAYERIKLKRDDKVIPLCLYFGIPDLIRSWIRKESMRTSKIVVFWDGDRHPERMKTCPEYKGQRKKDKKQHAKFLKMVSKAQKLLHYMGIAQAIDPEMEGDDMCYHLVKEYIVFNKIRIISGDKDFRQLVNNDVDVYDPRNGAVYTPALIGPSHYGLNVNQLVDFFCLTGDDSDNIKGYHGIGESKATAFLNKYGSIKAYLNSDDYHTGLSDKEKLGKIYKRNRKMIDLKYFNEKYWPDYEVKYYKGKYPTFDEAKYIEFCERYGLRSQRTPQFIQIIKSWHE
jgi:5'-3' exonuclease